MTKDTSLASGATVGADMDGEAADTVVTHATVLTLDSHRRVLSPGYVGVRQSRICAVDLGDPPHHLISAATEVIDARGGLLTPGLISTHQHVVDVLLRGLDQEHGLLEWSSNVYVPGTTEATPEDVETAVLLAMSEGVHAGITTVVDNWSASLDPSKAMESAEAALQAYDRTGVRVVFARMFADTCPESWRALLAALGPIGSDASLEKTDDVLSAIESLQRRHHGSGDGRIAVCPAPATAQFASAPGFAGCKELAERYDTILTTHHCETRPEAHMFAESGLSMTTTDYLGSIGVLGDRLLAAHCVWLEQRDIRMLASSRTCVAHCPTSNMMLGSGIAPVPALLAAGITVGLGCDNAMLNNNVSLLGEMRQASLLAKVGTLDAGAMTPERAIELATRDGAEAIRMGNELGVLEVGRYADLVLFDTSGHHWVPCHNPAAALVYQAHVDDVRMVMINGSVVLRDRCLAWSTDAAERQLLDDARSRASDLVSRSGLDRLRRVWRPIEH